MTDAEKRIREALADPALFDEGASVDDTLRACERWHAANSPEAIRELLAEWDELKADAERLRAERDDLRRQLDPMGEYASADELIAALRAEKAEDEAMKLDARRYRWLRNEANTARKCDPMVCIYPLDEQDLIDGDRLDVAIDAAMGLTRPAEE